MLEPSEGKMKVRKVDVMNNVKEQGGDTEGNLEVA